MSTKVMVPVIVTALMALVAGIVAFLWIGAGFSGYLDKVPFSGVHTFFNKGDMNIIFEDPLAVDHEFIDVWVDVDRVKIKIDPTLPGTAISASPGLRNRLSGNYAYYRARSVTVWTLDQNEKDEWENFLKDTKDSETSLKTQANQGVDYRKVTP